MKIAGRMLIIFIAALVVVGVTVALTGSSAGAGGRSPAVQEQNNAGVTTSTAAAGQAHGEFSGDRHNAPSLSGIISVVQNLLIIGVMVVLVSLAPRLKAVLARFGSPFHNTN